MHAKPLTLSALLALFLAGAAAAQPTAQPSFEAAAVWGSPQSPMLAAPGSTSLPLYVEVTNLGPAPGYNVSLTFEASYPLIPVKGVPSELTLRLPALPVGGTATIVGYYNVSPSVSPGVYEESVVVEYSLGGQTHTETLEVDVPILGVVDIELAGFRYTPSAIYPGYPYAELTVVLVNAGTATASSVSVSLNTSYPVYPLYQGSEKVSVGYMPVGQPVTLSFPLGVYNTSGAVNTTLTLTVSYNGGRSQSYTIPFTEYPKAVLEVVGVDTPTIRVGDGGDYVTVTVKNVGDAPAEYLTFTLLPSNVFQPSVPSSENPLLALTAVNESVGALLPGESVNVTYVIQVSSNIEQGTYTLSLLASWRQQGSPQPFTQLITVPINVHRTLLGELEQSLLGQTNPLLFFEIILALAVVVALMAAAARRVGRGRS